MKRHGRLFEATFTRERLYQAYLDARHKKRGKRAVHQFETNLGGELEALYWELHAGGYRPRPYFAFQIHEPKPRLIYAPAFRDRVVQHAIYRTVYPIFDRTFIGTSFACRVGYGTHRASLHVQNLLRQSDPDSYVLKLDVRKFFYRIDRHVLRYLVERKIKDARLLEVMLRFADDYQNPVGIPIGNLLSQLFALIYLNPLDHYIKRGLQIRHYARYVDDMLVVGVTREQALHIKARVAEFLADHLRLELSRYGIAKVRQGVNFVGWRTWRHRRLIRKHSLYKFRRALQTGDAAATVSLVAHARNTRSLPHLVTLIKEHESHGQNLSLSKNFRRLYDLPGPGHRGGARYRAMHP